MAAASKERASSSASPSSVRVFRPGRSLSSPVSLTASRSRIASASRRRPTNPEDVARRFIEPLGIVDETDQRTLRGDLGQQAQHRETHHEPIRRVSSRQPERNPQRLLLGLRQSGDLAEHRQTQLVQCRERHLQLGLDSCDLRDPTARRLAEAVVHQRGLADPRLTPYDQHRALTPTSAVQHAVERLALRCPPPEGRRRSCGHATRRYDLRPGVSAERVGRCGTPVVGPGSSTGARRGRDRHSLTMVAAETPSGRVAIVTGGSRGIGRETVHRLANRGDAVVVNYAHDQRAAEATVETVLARNGAAVAIRADVSDDLDVERLFSATIEAFGGIDVVVHAVHPRLRASSDGRGGRPRRPRRTVEHDLAAHDSRQPRGGTSAP